MKALSGEMDKKPKHPHLSPLPSRERKLECWSEAIERTLRQAQGNRPMRLFRQPADVLTQKFAKEVRGLLTVMPAKAGIQTQLIFLDSGSR